MYFRKAPVSYYFLLKLHKHFWIIKDQNTVVELEYCRFVSIWYFRKCNFASNLLRFLFQNASIMQMLNSYKACKSNFPRFSFVFCIFFKEYKPQQLHLQLTNLNPNSALVFFSHWVLYSKCYFANIVDNERIGGAGRITLDLTFCNSTCSILYAHCSNE